MVFSKLSIKYEGFSVFWTILSVAKVVRPLWMILSLIQHCLNSICTLILEKWNPWKTLEKPLTLDKGQGFVEGHEVLTLTLTLLTLTPDPWRVDKPLHITRSDSPRWCEPFVNSQSLFSELLFTSNCKFTYSRGDTRWVATSASCSSSTKLCLGYFCITASTIIWCIFVRVNCQSS